MIARIKKFSLHYFLTQFTITLVSLPILIQWGISISTASLVGNLLFLPFLATFLFGCSILFMLTLVGCTCTALYLFLEWVVKIWHLILDQGSTSWLVSFAAPPIILCWILPLLSLAYLITTRQTIQRKAMIIGTLLGAQLTFLQLYTWKQQRVRSVCTQLPKMLIFYEPSIGVIVHDQGFFRKQDQGMNIIPYKFMPTLIRTYGTRTISYLIIDAGFNSFTHALQLCSYAQVKTIIIPKTKKKFTKKTWFHFFELKRHCEEKGTRLLRYLPHTIKELAERR